MSNLNILESFNRIRDVETVRVYLLVGFGDVFQVLRRKFDSKKNGGLWEAPGGQREEGETREHCIVRETHEETGLWIKIGKLIPLEERHVDDADMLGCYSAWGCEGRAISGDFKLEKDHIEAAQIESFNLPQLELTTVTTTLIGMHNRGKFDL